MTASNFCQGSAVFPFTILDMIPRAVSDPAQKNGGDLSYTICNSFGTNSSASPGDTGLLSADGRT